MLVMGSTISPLIVISICMLDPSRYEIGTPAAVSSGRARLALAGCSGFAAVIRTGTICPIHCGRAREVHDRVAAGAARELPVAPPAARVHQHVLDACRRACRYSSPWMSLCSACSVDDPPRLLLLRHVVWQALQRERVRPRRVLEREHAVIPDRRRQRQRLLEVARRSRPGSRRSYRSTARCPAWPRAAARRAPGSPRACAAAASPPGPAWSRTAPAGAGAGRPSAGRASRAIIRGVTCRGCGLANRIRSSPSTSLQRARAAPAKSQAGSSGAW